MKTRSKALLLALCAVLLVAASVLGTMAYLTDTKTVTNTFTVGSVGIKLDETDVDEYGEKVSETRVGANSYKLIPGRTYIKDPMVTVEAGSEAAYVRMIVTVKTIDQLKLALPQKDTNGTAIAANAQYYTDLNSDSTADFVLEKLLDSSWNYNAWHFAGYSEHENTGIYEFRYKEVVARSESETKLPALFEKIKVPGEIDNTHLNYLKNVEIVVNAHAIQADGFADAAAAWSAFDTP